jgi:predicted RNA methylase
VEDTEKVFTSYDIQACLYDERRVGYFRRAIADTVRPGDIVVDGGSGTGLLGMFAARAGAAKVYCVEINGDYVKVIEENARRNGMSDVIVAIQADATKCSLPEDVDVITSEVISAGFFYEPQLQIVSNLKRFLRPTGSIIPLAMDNSIELIDAQEELYGLTFTYDTRYRSLNDVALTEPSIYLSTKFLQDTSTSIVGNVRLRAVRSGTANAVRISYGIAFTPDVWADEPTEFLMNPQIIFLSEPYPLRENECYEISVAYQSSSSPLTCEISISHV